MIYKKVQSFAVSSQGEIVQTISILLSSLATILYKLSLTHYNIDTFLFLNSICCIFLCGIFVLFQYILKYNHCIKVNKLLCTKLMLVNAVALCTYFVAIHLLHPAAFVLFSRFFVFFSLLSSYFYLKERVSMEECIFLFFLLVGGICIAYDSELDSLMLNVTGVATAIFSSFSFSVFYSMVAKHANEHSRNHLIMLSNFFSYCVLLIILIVFHTPELRKFTTISIDYKFLCLVFLSNICIFASLLLFFKGVGLLNFRYSISFRAATPIFVLILSWPFFPLELNFLNVFGFTVSFICLLRISYLRHSTKTA